MNAQQNTTQYQTYSFKTQLTAPKVLFDIHDNVNAQIFGGYIRNVKKYYEIAENIDEKEDLEKACDALLASVLKINIDKNESMIGETISTIANGGGYSNKPAILYGIANRFKSFDSDVLTIEDPDSTAFRRAGGQMTMLSEAINYVADWIMYTRLFDDEKYSCNAPLPQPVGEVQ